MSGVWIPLIPFLFFFLWLFFVGLARGKVCPDCSTPFPFFQSPITKTRRQWVVGGYRCANCGCQTNLDGLKVNAAMLPSRRFIAISVSLLALSTLFGMILLVLLLRR